LRGLPFDVEGAVRCGLAAEEGKAIALHDTAHALVGFDTVDFQHVNS
jgi:hypothetical protein